MHRILYSTAALTVLASSAFASPSVGIMNPPTQPNPSWTGPEWDPNSTSGQWFKRRYGGAYEVRWSELYDNKYDTDPSKHTGGGSLMRQRKPGEGVRQWGSTNSVYGKVTKIVRDVWNGDNDIVGFTIEVTITNDLPALTDWYRGESSHGEWRKSPPANPSNPNDSIDDPVTENDGYLGRLISPRLAIGFAIAGLTNLPPTWDPPYSLGQTNPGHPNYIIAENYDALAWYSWAPRNSPKHVPEGGFWIPTYDFGNLLPGEQQTRTIDFHSSDDHGIKPNDPRFSIIEWSYNSPIAGGDIFLARSTDLKNGDWIEDMAMDLGDAYPGNPFKGANVAVFHNVVAEPAGLLAIASSLIGFAGFVTRRRR